MSFNCFIVFDSPLWIFSRVANCFMIRTLGTHPTPQRQPDCLDREELLAPFLTCDARGYCSGQVMCVVVYKTFWLQIASGAPRIPWVNTSQCPINTGILCLHPVNNLHLALPGALLCRSHPTFSHEGPLPALCFGCPSLPCCSR